MKKLKVYGGLTFRYIEGKRSPQVRTIVGAYSQKQAVEILKLTLYELRDYWGETGNRFELQLANERPLTIIFPGDEAGAGVGAGN